MMPQHRIRPLEQRRMMCSQLTPAAVPFPMSLPIPQGCAAFLQLAREFPPASELPQNHCCCTVRTPQAGAEQQPELGTGLCLAAHGKSVPGRAGSTPLAIPTLQAFSWESPAPWHCLCFLGMLGAAHTCTCTPTCARLPLFPPQNLGTMSCSYVLGTFPAGHDAPGSSARGASPSLAAATNKYCS